MQSTKTPLDILQGLDDIKYRRFSKKSILDWQGGKKQPVHGRLTMPGQHYELTLPAEKNLEFDRSFWL